VTISAINHRQKLENRAFCFHTAPDALFMSMRKQQRHEAAVVHDGLSAWFLFLLGSVAAIRQPP
jgi:hypothetical protein